MTAPQSRMMISLRPLLVGTAGLAAPWMAMAHHAHDYAPPETLSQGLASGLAHPLLSAPHLVALVVLGLLAAAGNAGFRLIATFCAGSLATALVFGAGVAEWPVHDLWVAFSLAVGAIGLWQCRRQELPVNITAMLIAGAAGSIHGQIAAESIETADMLILGAYWCGITLSQAAIAITTVLAVRRVVAIRREAGPFVRMGGAAISAGAALAVLWVGV